MLVKDMKEQGGQVVVILLLILIVALAIGLSVVGRSINEISTSTKTEESSRAYSAAEAGIERALQRQLNQTSSDTTPVSLKIGNNVLNNSSTTNVDIYHLPKPSTALEYPPFGKESFAQFWLAHPDDIDCSETRPDCYTQGAFLVYFGAPREDDYASNPNDRPAIEVNVISRGNLGDYINRKYYYDSYGGSSGRPSTRPGIINNIFEYCETKKPSVIPTNASTTADRAFYCRVRVPGALGPGNTRSYTQDTLDPFFPSLTPAPTSQYPPSETFHPVMVRVRLLFTNGSHPVAILPLVAASCQGGNPKPCSLPPQVNIYNSTGSAGSVARTIQVFQQKSVMPLLFDYALFSAGTLEKRP